MKKSFRLLEEKLTASQIIMLGFLCVIAVGTLILMMPFCSMDGRMTSWVDALFTATTSTCVTGLVTVSTYGHWSMIGKVVILTLIQIGGLGFMTCFTMMLMAFGKRVTLRERMVIQDSLNETGLTGMVRLVRRMIKGTVCVEGIGALFYMVKLVPEYGIKGIFYSIFTSVSAFCNAGMDLFGDTSLVRYVHDYYMNVVTMVLIVLGGLGFTVWWDVLDNLKKARMVNAFKRKPWKVFQKGLSLHTKLVLATTVILIGLGAFIVFLAEYNNEATMAHFTIPQKLLASIFQSVTTRTAGFQTIPQENFSISSQLVSVILMFIGGSSAGTAGGVKTTTIAVIVLMVLSAVRGREHTEVFERTIPTNTIRKAFTITTISVVIVVGATMLLSVLQPLERAMPLLYETVSALATVGLSQGLTGSLTIPAKLLMIVMMFIGRIGPMTMAFAIGTRLKAAKDNIKYPDENVLVG